MSGRPPQEGTSTGGGYRDSPQIWRLAPYRKPRRPKSEMDLDQLIEECFTIFDEDGDQRIDLKELRYLLTVVYKKTPDDATVQEFMSRFDADGNGTIELEEFKELFYVIPCKPQGQSLKELFTKYDANGDGDLQFCEVKHFLEDLGDQPSDDVLKQLMEEMDHNKDGRIDFREFCIMFGRSLRVQA